MNSKNLYSLYFIIASVTCLFTNYDALCQSIVEQHGRLQVSGNKIVNKDGVPISLAGNSLFWSTAGDTSNFYNKETVSHLANHWNSSIIRVAMGVKENWDGGNGYIDNPEAQKKKIRKVIDAAINDGIYVIIDWHTHEAERYQTEAINFFREMAELYGNKDNIIYEIYNEPIHQTWNEIKSYANRVIAAIRSKDPDNMIIVGTSTWSQEVDIASNDPIRDQNTAYTLHFYAGTHKNELRKKAKRAMDNGIALFVTEWGAVNADGKGIADRQETNRWMQFLMENSISHLNWAVSDKAEGASIVASGAGTSGLINNNLADTGLFVRDIIKNWKNQNSPPNCTGNGLSITGLIQAEDYCAQSGTKLEPTTDIGEGKNVGYIDVGDYIEYRLDIPENGQYSINFRVAALSENIKFNFSKGNTILTNVNSGPTGAWQNWKTIVKTIGLSSGPQTLRIEATGKNWNINWLQIKSTTTLNKNKEATSICMYPMPAKDILYINKIEKKSSIYISDFTGKIILTPQIDIDHKKIDVSELNSGNYIITIINGTQKSSFQLVKE